MVVDGGEEVGSGVFGLVKNLGLVFLQRESLDIVVNVQLVWLFAHCLDFFLHEVREIALDVVFFQRIPNEHCVLLVLLLEEVVPELRLLHFSVSELPEVLLVVLLLDLWEVAEEAFLVFFVEQNDFLLVLVGFLDLDEGKDFLHFRVSQIRLLDSFDQLVSRREEILQLHHLLLQHQEVEESLQNRVIVELLELLLRKLSHHQFYLFLGLIVLLLKHILQGLSQLEKVVPGHANEVLFEIGEDLDCVGLVVLLDR